MQFLRPDKTDVEILLGEPKRAIRMMFMPFLIAFAIVEANQFIDIFWISGLGTASAEAISTVVPFYAFLMTAGVGVSVGATTTVAFRLGRNEPEDAGRLASNSVILGMILSVAASVIIFLILDVAIDILGAGGIRTECKDYMLPMIILSPALILLSILAGLLRGEGAARKSTIVQISAAILNMVMDPFFIYGMGMGIMGAGLATGLSALMSVMIGISWYIRRRTVVSMDRRNFRIDRSAMSEVFYVGGPRLANELIGDVAVFVQRIFFIVAGGTAAVMLYNYPWRFIALFSLPNKALENSLVPVGSAAYGQNDLDKMWAGYMYCLKYTVGISLVVTAAIILFAEPLISIMTYEQSMSEMFDQLVWTLRVAVLLLPFMTLRGIGVSFLQAMKKVRIPLYFDLIWSPLRLVFYALSAYGLLGVDPFEGIIYIMVIMYSFNGIIMTALALNGFRKLRKSVENFN